MSLFADLLTLPVHLVPNKLREKLSNLRVYICNQRIVFVYNNSDFVLCDLIIDDRFESLITLVEGTVCGNVIRIRRFGDCEFTMGGAQVGVYTTEFEGRPHVHNLTMKMILHNLGILNVISEDKNYTFVQARPIETWGNISNLFTFFCGLHREYSRLTQAAYVIQRAARWWLRRKRVIAKIVRAWMMRSYYHPEITKKVI